MSDKKEARISQAANAMMQSIVKSYPGDVQAAVSEALCRYHQLRNDLEGIIEQNAKLLLDGIADEFEARLGAVEKRVDSLESNKPELNDAELLSGISRTETPFNSP